MSRPILLVTGANGKLGRQVVKFLLEAGNCHVIAASRDTSRLSDLAALGAETRQADFNDEATLLAAFANVDRVLIISTDSLGSGERLAQHQAAVRSAAAAGVKGLVYTSMPRPEVSSVTFAGDHLGTEQAIIASGLPYTILRNAWYQENLLMNLPAAFASGTLYTSAGEGKISYIAHLDCARAATAALLAAPSHETLTLTGSRLYTMGEVAALAAQATGKPLGLVQVTDAQLAEGMKAAGVPLGLIAMLVSFDTNTRTGGFDILTDDFERLTGLKPLALPEFLNTHKAALAA